MQISVSGYMVEMDGAIVDRMKAAGFNLEHMGGGCIAFARKDGEIEELVTLPDSPCAPEEITDPALVGTYNTGDDGSFTEGYTMADVLAALENPSDEYFLLSLRLDNGFHRDGR